MDLSGRAAAGKAARPQAPRSSHGAGKSFDRAIAELSELYADQSERDHAALAAAIESGRVEAEDAQR